MGVTKVVLTWGDGSVNTVDSYSPSVTSTGSVSKTHNYLTAGKSYNVTAVATDTAGQNSAKATITCAYPAPANYNVTGIVKNQAGTALSSAYLTLRYTKTGTIKSVYTGSNGAFVVSNMPDGTAFTITVAKSPYTFSSPAYTGVVSGGPLNVGTISSSN